MPSIVLNIYHIQYNSYTKNTKKTQNGLISFLNEVFNIQNWLIYYAIIFCTNFWVGLTSTDVRSGRHMYWIHQRHLDGLRLTDNTKYHFYKARWDKILGNLSIFWWRRMTILNLNTSYLTDSYISFTLKLEFFAQLN